jgi:hypothetical protein
MMLCTRPKKTGGTESVSIHTPFPDTSDHMTHKTNHRILCQSKDLETATLHVSRYFKQSIAKKPDRY